MSIEVTARDTDTGETNTVVLEPGEYVVTCAEPAHITNEQIYARTGTHVITVKRRTREATP